VNRAFKLYRLQQADSRLDEARGRLAEIERLLADDETMRAAAAGFQAAEASMLAAAAALRAAEDVVKTQQTHIEQNQASLYGGKVTNPKELQDLQKEDEALTRQLRTLEDAQLSKMAELEEKQADLAKANEVVEGLKAQQAVEQRVLHSEQSKLKEDLPQLEDEQSTTLHGIEKADLDLYESLRKSKAGVAVAKVDQRTCSACGSELSAATAQAAKATSELARCDSCKRILYGG
jgi:predicted  nucleic acid-binding Zn-ribbon protein